MIKRIFLLSIISIQVIASQAVSYIGGFCTFSAAACGYLYNAFADEVSQRRAHFSGNSETFEDDYAKQEAEIEGVQSQRPILQQCLNLAKKIQEEHCYHREPLAERTQSILQLRAASHAVKVFDLYQELGQIEAHDDGTSNACKCEQPDGPFAPLRRLPCGPGHEKYRECPRLGASLNSIKTKINQKDTALTQALQAAQKRKEELDKQKPAYQALVKKKKNAELAKKCGLLSGAVALTSAMCYFLNR